METPCGNLSRHKKSTAINKVIIDGTIFFGRLYAWHVNDTADAGRWPRSPMSAKRQGLAWGLQNDIRIKGTSMSSLCAALLPFLLATRYDCACHTHTHTHVLLGHRSWRVNQQHRFHRNTLQNITYLFIVTCGTHCIILLLQLELFPSLQPNQPEATWHLFIACFSLSLFFLVLFVCFCPDYPVKPLLNAKWDDSTRGWADREGRQGASSSASHQNRGIKRNHPFCAGGLYRQTVLTGKKKGGKEKKQTPKMDQNRMNTAVRKRHVFRCFSSDPRNGGASGHALNTEPRPIGKGCAQRHPGSDHSHTRYREMTVARGARVHGPAKVSGHYQRMPKSNPQ